jgi:hypothetical protein
MGKRLIGKAMVVHPDIKSVLQKGTLAIIAGTTNGYIAEEVLKSIDQADGFSREGFRRGMTVAPGAKAGRSDFLGDVIIVDGEEIYPQEKRPSIVVLFQPPYNQSAGLSRKRLRLKAPIPVVPAMLIHQPKMSGRCYAFDETMKR